MGRKRSDATVAIAAALTDTPQTIRDFCRVLGLSMVAAQNSASSLLACGEAQEVWVDGEYGRKVRGYKLPRTMIAAPIERGEYTGERRPLRYVQRDVAGVTIPNVGL